MYQFTSVAGILKTKQKLRKNYEGVIEPKQLLETVATAI